MTSELQVRNPSRDLYVRALSSAWRNTVELHDPSVWLTRDPEAEEKMLRDPDIAHAIGYRRTLIAGRQWGVVPRREAPRAPVAVLVATEALEQIHHFTAARFALARSFFSGARFARIHGGPKKLRIGDGKLRTWWIPQRLEDVDKRVYRIVPTREDEQIQAHWERWSIKEQKFVPLTLTEARTTIKHVYNDDQGHLGYGLALREALGWVWYAKSNIAQETLQAIERYAGGLLHIRINGARDAATGLPNETLINAWRDLAEKLRGRHVLVSDKEDEVEVIQGNAGGSEVLDNMRAEMRSTIFTLVLGANLTTSADKGGSFALADVQENSTEALVQYDREILEETLTKDLLGCIWSMNHPNLVELGIVDDMPRFSITQEKREDPVQRGNVAQVLNTIGVSLALDEVLEQTGFRKPEAGEEIVAGAKPAPPPGPGGPGAPFGLQFYTPHVPAGRPDGGEFMPGHGKGQPPERGMKPEDRPSSKPAAPTKAAPKGKTKAKPKAPSAPQKAGPQKASGEHAYTPAVGDRVVTINPKDGQPLTGKVVKQGEELGRPYLMVQDKSGDLLKVRPGQVGRADSVDKPHTVGGKDHPVVLTSSELQAVISYTGNDFLDINDALRSPQGSEQMKDDVAAKIAHMDAAIARNIIGEAELFVPLGTESVFRGARLEHFGLSKIKDLKEGMEIGNHGYVSTSRDPKIARSFARQGGPGSIVLKIQTGPNSRGLDVEGLSEHRGENEVILARKSKFRVTGIDRKHPDGYDSVTKKYHPVVTVEHIDPHEDPKKDQ